MNDGNTGYPWSQGDPLLAADLNAAIAAASAGALPSGAARAIISDTSPPDPYPGLFWFDSANPQLYLWYSDPNSSQWVIATANAGGLSADAPVDGNVYGRSNGTWSAINQTSLGGPFLPLVGGTVSGPITLPGNAATALQAIPLQQLTAAVTVSVKTSGAKGDGVTDDTAAIQAAANAILASGSILLFPPGVYVLNTTILVPSNTLVLGQGATLLAKPTGFTVNGALLANVNNAATTLTDHDITVQNMTFDYGTSNPGGGAHAIRMSFVRNVAAVNCTMQCRGAGNAISMIGCYNSLVDGCTAYGFINCGYDHWWNPRRGRVVNSYAESAASSQMANWNPEATTSGGTTANEFVLANNHFVATSSAAIPIQIEPLSAGTTVRDVVITGNTFVNVMLTMRGAVTAAIVSGNVFDSVAGGIEVIRTYAQNGGNPVDVSIIGNVVLNPGTVPGSIGVIRVGTSSAIIANNIVDGGTANGIDTASFAPIAFGNYVSNGLLNMPFAIAQTGMPQFTAMSVSGFSQFGWSGADTVFGTQAAAPVAATAGHVLIPFCAGQPTGVPTNAAKGIAVQYDTTNHKLWCYDNGTNTWRGTVMT